MTTADTPSRGTGPTLYVAGSSADIGRAQMAMEAARAIGFAITYDWTASIVEAGGVANPIDAAPEDARRWSLAAVRGVRIAQFVWLLCPHGAPSQGAFFEFAVAYCGEHRTIASGPWHCSIFTSLADERVATDEEALEVLRQWRAR